MVSCLQEWKRRVARRSLQATEYLSSYGPKLAPESASEGVFFAQMRSFADIQTAAPDQAPAAPAPAPFTQQASVPARAAVPATAVSPAEAEAAPASDAAAPQGAAEAAGGARNESAGSSPCDALEGGPAEWMQTGGAMGLACAQQVTDSPALCSGSAPFPSSSGSLTVSVALLCARCTHTRDNVGTSAISLLVLLHVPFWSVSRPPCCSTLLAYITPAAAHKNNPLCCSGPWARMLRKEPHGTPTQDTRWRGRGRGPPL